LMQRGLNQRRPFLRKPGLLVGVGLVLLILLGGILYFLIDGRVQPFPRQASAPSPTPPPEITGPEKPWTTYENRNPKFSISYPADWKKKVGRENSRRSGGIYLYGAEGSLTLNWESDAKGAACPRGDLRSGGRTVGISKGWEELRTSSEILKGCHVVLHDKSEYWSGVKKTFPYTNFVAGAHVRAPSEKNRATVLQILSTLKFTGG
jgi:hypothetical protein